MDDAPLRWTFDDPLLGIHQVLADRYQKLAGKTAKHEKANEVAYEVMLEDSFEVKKNGCAPSIRLPWKQLP